MSPDRDDFQDDDEQDDFASRSIYSAGWFRAVLVLTVLAIVVVISLPYLLNWFEPAAPARSQSAESPPPAPGPTAPPGIAPAPAPVPAAPIAAAPEVKPPAPVSPTPKAAVVPPPAPKAVAESKALPSATSGPARKAAADRAPAKRTEEAPASTASKRPAVTRVVAKADGPSPSAVGSIRPSAAPSGSYWIQLGAFKDQKNAVALAKSLRDAGFPVQVSSSGRGNGGGSTAGAPQQHELFVTGASPEKVNAALKGRGKAQAVAGGVAVKPPFSLQEAVTVSKRLSDQGLTVVIRPAGGVAIASQSAGALHAVRAGGYPNRASALAARNELAAKGHPGFVAEGPAK